VRELADQFRRDVPAACARLRAAADQHARAELAVVAHTLKSSSAIFGARALAATCATLEQLAKANELDRANALVSEIEQLGVDALASIDTQLARLAAA